MLLKKVQIDGHTIKYWVVDSQTKGATILFLHGFGLQASSYRLSLKALGNHYRLVAPNFPSPSKNGFKASYQSYALFVKAFLAKTGIKSVHIIGHSMGGGIAAATAALHPELVDSLILANPTGILLPPISKIVKNRPSELIKQASASGFRRQNIHFLGSFFKTLLANPVANFKLMSLPAKRDLRPLLGQIKAPCLLAWGVNDCMVPKEHGLEFKSLIPNSRLLLLNNCFHEWCLIESTKLVDISRNFYREHI